MANSFTHAWRTIGRMPGLAAVVVVSLGIGIGVNTTVFSWIQALVLEPFPGVSGSSDFFLVEPRSEAGTHPGVSWPEYRDLQEQLGSFDALVAFRVVPLNVGETSRLERTYGNLVSGNYFAGLGVKPALGRFMRPDEVVRPGSEPVVVVSHGFWQTRLGGVPSALGQTLRINGSPVTVIGVTPAGFQGTVTGLDFDLWVPATLAPVLLAGSTELENRGVRGYQALGRLRPGTPRAEAQRELDEAMRQLAADYPNASATFTGEVLPVWQTPRGPRRLLVGALAVLQTVMLLLLLAVCGNIANLVLARASTRQREIGVRMALGAGRWRIVGLLLAENLILALLGAALGAAIAVWGTDAMRVMPMSFAFPVRFQTSVDGLGLAFAALLGVGSGLLFGLIPALQLARLGGAGSLRSAPHASGRSRLREALMAVQVGLALVVLVVAATFYKSFAETRDMDPGFRRQGVLLGAYDFTGRNVDAGFTRDFASRLLDRLRALPAVESAAIASSVPLDIHGLPLRTFTLEGRARTDRGRDGALANTVTPDYFTLMGIPLRAGRTFTDLNDTATSAQAIVNEEFVRRYVGDGEAVGRWLETGGRRFTIAGVVATSSYESFGEPPTPAVYFSYRDRPSGQGEIHVRTRAGAETRLAPELRRVMVELDPALPLYNVRTLDDHIETNLLFRRIPARMFAVLGPLLLALAAVGIYAVVAYAVSQRTREIGVRLALGATAPRVVAQLVGETLRVVTLGALAGWAIAFIIDRDFVRRGPLDPAIFAGMPAVLLLVAAFASWLPARRSARIDPVVALRTE